MKFIVLIACVGIVSCCTNNAQRDGLMDFYCETGGPNWYNSTNWGDNNYCEWYGVQCDTNCNVFQLDLSNNNLTGIISDSLNNLDLSLLFLQNNTLTGTLDRVNWNSLLTVDLSNNYFVGSFPNGSHLTVAKLRNNHFNDTLGRITPTMQLLDVRDNNIDHFGDIYWCDDIDDDVYQYCLNYDELIWDGKYACPTISNNRNYITILVDPEYYGGYARCDTCQGI